MIFICLSMFLVFVSISLFWKISSQVYLVNRFTDNLCVALIINNQQRDREIVRDKKRIKKTLTMDLQNISRIAESCLTNETDNGFLDTIKPMVIICFSLIGITGFLGNTLVIFVVLMNPQMRSTTNMLIINLAIADLLFVIFCVPFTAIDYVAHEWPLGNAWCKIDQYLIIVTAMASIYTLVLMSLDRFLAVVYPISSRSFRNEQNALIAVTVLWILILSIAIPVIFAHGVVVSNQ